MPAGAGCRQLVGEAQSALQASSHHLPGLSLAYRHAASPDGRPPTQLLAEDHTMQNAVLHTTCSGANTAASTESCLAHTNTRKAAPTWAMIGPSALPSLLPVKLAAGLPAALVGHCCGPLLLLPPCSCGEMPCLRISASFSSELAVSYAHGRPRTWLRALASHPANRQGRHMAQHICQLTLPTGRWARCHAEPMCTGGSTPCPLPDLRVTGRDCEAAAALYVS